MMASGKSTVGRLLAGQLGVPFQDLDDVVVARAGMSIAEIFARLGEAAFRAMEREALATLPAGAVVALGGGAVPPADATVICLTAGMDETLRRLEGAAQRPLLSRAPDPRLELESLLEKRASRYREADLTVDTTDRKPESVAEEIATWIRSRSN